MVVLNRLRRGNKLLHRFGWHLSRYHSGYQRQLLLQRHHVDLVVDVGANVGQYGTTLREFGYPGLIVSLEPMSKAAAQLAEVSKRDGRWELIRAAAGPSKGEITINIAGNSISSSALPMLDRHSDLAPNSRYVAQETAPVDTLDSLVASHVQHASRPYLKIDTQGYERAVLEGATGVLAKAVAVEMEMSFVPLYEGQMLFRDAIGYMEAVGFELAALFPGLWDPGTGETLQADGVFVAKDGTRT